MISNTIQYKSYVEAEKNFMAFMQTANPLMNDYETKYVNVSQSNEKHSLEKSFNILNTVLENLRVTDKERFEIFNVLGQKLKEFTAIITPKVVADKTDFDLYSKLTSGAVKACEMQGEATTRSNKLSKNIDMLKIDLVAERKHERIL